MDEHAGAAFGEQAHGVVPGRLQRRRGCNRGAVSTAEGHFQTWSRWTVEFDLVTDGDTRQLLVRVECDNGNRGGEGIGVRGIQEGEGAFLALLKHDPATRGRRWGGLGINHAANPSTSRNIMFPLCWQA